MGRDYYEFNTKHVQIKNVLMEPTKITKLFSGTHKQTLLNEKTQRLTAKSKKHKVRNTRENLTNYRITKFSTTSLTQNSQK